MHVHPRIAALRTDREPQRRAQAAMEAARADWRERDCPPGLAEDFAAYGEGRDLGECPVLAALFEKTGAAEALLAGLSQRFCAAIRANPVGHPPFRHGFDGHTASLLLARSGRAQLMLQSREPGTCEISAHVFSDAVRHDAIVAGEATGALVEMTERPGRTVGLSERPVYLVAGDRQFADLSRQALALCRIERRLVMLRLVRSAEKPGPVREYDAADGSLRQCSAGQIATSRQEAIVTLLARMGRGDAASDIARVAVEDGDISLRWQALREVLALDTRTGFAALCDLAGRPTDPLAAQAGALRAQLLETHPALARLENAPCPA